MAYREVVHDCVACGAALELAERDGAQLERCPRCGGMWIEYAALLALLRSTPTAQHPDELLEFNDGGTRRPCPHCHATMDQVWIGMVDLERCAEHGVWLDRGELDAALRSAKPPVLIGFVPPPKRRGR